MSNKKDDNVISIKGLWQQCMSHWHWFVLSLLVSGAAAVYYLQVTPALYRCTATLMVRQESEGKKGSSNIGEEISDMGFIVQNYNVNNVVQHISSLDVLIEVAKELYPEKDENELITAAQGIRGRFKAEILDKQSTIITLTYKDFSYEKAEKILTLIIMKYNDKWLHDKQVIASNTSNFIDVRLRLLEHDLDQVDDSISTFKSRHKITDLSHVSELYLQQQSQTDAEILKLRNQKSVAEYIHNLLADNAADHQLLPANSGINNSVAESQIALYNTMLMQYNSHLNYTSPQNPLIINQEREMNTLRSNILKTIDNQISALEIQLQSLQGASGETTSKITANPSQAKYLVSIEREQKVKESLYLYLLQKKEENEISIAYRTNNTQMLDRPNGSTKPASPKKSYVYAIAALLGVMIPVVVLFLRSMMDENVYSRNEIERFSSLPMLGDLTQYNKGRLSFIPLPFFNIMRRRRTPKIVVADGKQNIINESFRMIRTKMETDIENHKGENVYMMASFKDGDGKTFVSANLAVAFAIHKKRVAYIDADMRHGGASNIWGLKSMTGLSEYLNDEYMPLDQVLYTIESHPTLSVLPVGELPSNPTELLYSKRFEEMVKRLSEDYDVVLIDTPKAEEIADADIVAQQADATLFVVRAGHTDRSRMGDVDETQKSGRFKKVSIILNGTNPKRGGKQ